MDTDGMVVLPETLPTQSMAKAAFVTKTQASRDNLPVV